MASDCTSPCLPNQTILEKLHPNKCRYCTRYFNNIVTYLRHTKSHQLKYHKLWHTRSRLKRSFSKKSTREISPITDEGLKYVYLEESDKEILVYQYSKGNIFKNICGSKIFGHIPRKFLTCQYMLLPYRNKEFPGAARNMGIKHHYWKGGLKIVKPFVKKVGKYACSICSKSFHKAYALKLHQRLHSTSSKSSEYGGRSFPCKVCSKVFSKADVLELHKRSHNFRTSEKMLVKNKNHEDITKSELILVESGEEFVQSDETFKCRHCMQIFCDYDEWELHERAHTLKDSNQKVLTLKICGTVSAFSESIKIKQEDDQKPVQAASEATSVKVEEKETEEDHKQMKVVLTVDEVQPSVKAEVKKKSLQPLLRPKLLKPKLFPVGIKKEDVNTVRPFSQLFKAEQSDQKPVHSITGEVKTTSSTTQVSNDHDVQLMDKKELLLKSLSLRKVTAENTRLEKVTKQLQHQLQKNKLLAFPMINTGAKLREGGQLLPCRFCPMWFATVSELSQHSRTHSHLKNLTSKHKFQCGLCGKFFTQGGSLRAHERIHTGERPYKCDLCGKSFHESGKLRRHERTHTGEKRYQCGWCGRRFAQNGTRKSHEKTHTGTPKGHGIMES